MMKKLLIVLAIVVAGAVALTTAMVSTNNRAITLEEQVNESVSAMKVHEKRRVDLILNLVDTVKDYNKHEKDTLKELTQARTEAQNGNVESAQMAIKAVAEAYPELKSVDNYKNLMNELSITENLIAEQRTNYNRQVKAYSKFVRRFPNSMILGIMGYERQDYKYLDFADATPDSPKNLFEGK